MMRRGLVTLMAAAALGACGGDDDGADDAARTPTAPPAAEDGGAPQRVEMTEFAFSPEDVRVERGDALLAENVGQQPHNLTIEEGGSRQEAGRELAATSDVAPDGMERLAVDVAPGEYTLVCTVPGHREAGMVGAIVIE